jgi:hypothetical protein
LWGWRGRREERREVRVGRVALLESGVELQSWSHVIIKKGLEWDGAQIWNNTNHRVAGSVGTGDYSNY